MNHTQSGSTNHPLKWAVLIALIVALAVSLAACGGDDGNGSAVPAEESSTTTSDTGSDGGADDDSESDTSSGSIDNAPPSGQASASVDGQSFTFELPGALACSISDESLTYSYRIGDNEVTLGAGVNRVDNGWMGSISLTIANPAGEPGPIGYYPAPGDNGILDESLFTIDGDTALYEGPMLKQPANDGSQPPPVDVGTGTIVATC